MCGLLTKEYYIVCDTAQLLTIMICNHWQGKMFMALWSYKITSLRFSSCRSREAYNVRGPTYIDSDVNGAPRIVQHSSPNSMILLFWCSSMSLPLSLSVSQTIILMDGLKILWEETVVALDSCASLWRWDSFGIAVMGREGIKRKRNSSVWEIEWNFRIRC